MSIAIVLCAGCMEGDHSKHEEPRGLRHAFASRLCPCQGDCVNLFEGITAEMVEQASRNLEFQRQVGALLIQWKYCPRRKVRARREAKRKYKTFMRYGHDASHDAGHASPVTHDTTLRRESGNPGPTS